MKIDTWEITGSDEVLFCVDPEGVSVEEFLDALRRAASDQLDADIHSSPQGRGWMVFGDGRVFSLGMQLEILARNIVVKPEFFDQDGVDVPLEDMVLLLHHANAMLDEPDEVSVVLDDLLGEMVPKARAADIDELTGLVDDDGITVEIDLSGLELTDGVEYALEGFGGLMTPIPRTVPQHTPPPLPYLGK